jgi:hypothetical protein
MSDELAQWHVFEYEGFEIHVLPQLYENPQPLPHRAGARYAYIGHVCRHGAHANMPGEAVHFHADGDDILKTADEALQDGRRIGRSIIDGTHPDLSILPLVSHHHPE